MCNNQIIKSDGHSAQCVIMANEDNLHHFLVIKEKYDKLQIGKAVPNNECPFFYMKIQEECPFYQANKE